MPNRYRRARSELCFLGNQKWGLKTYHNVDLEYLPSCQNKTDGMYSMKSWRISNPAKAPESNKHLMFTTLTQQDVTVSEEAMQQEIDKGVLAAYFHILTDLANNENCPQSIGDIACKLQLSRNNHFGNTIDNLEKIPIWNLQIADSPELRNDIRVKLLYLTQTPLDLQTRQKVRRISKPPMGLVLDDQSSIVKFVPMNQKFGSILRRENEMKGYSDVNPVPWAYDEIEDLLDFIRDKTCEDLMVTELKIRCSQFRFASNTKRTVDSLHAKAFQYIANGLGPMFTYTFKQQMTMFFFLKIKPNRAFWRELYKQCRFQADENHLISYCSLPKYVLGYHDKTRPLSIPGEQIFTFLNIVATTRFLPLTMEELAEEFLIMFPNYNYQENVVKEFQDLTYKDVTKKVNDGVLQIRIFFVTQIPVSKAQLTSFKHYGKITFQRMKVASFETPLKDLVLKKPKMIKIPGGKPKTRATKGVKRARAPSPGVIFKKSPRPEKSEPTQSDYAALPPHIYDDDYDLYRYQDQIPEENETDESDSNNSEENSDQDQDDDDEHIDVETISTSSESDVEEVLINDADFDNNTGNAQAVSKSSEMKMEEVIVNVIKHNSQTGSVHVQVPTSSRNTRALPVNDTKSNNPTGKVQVPVQTSSRDTRALPVNNNKFDSNTRKVQVPASSIEDRALSVNETKFDGHTGKVPVPVQTSSGDIRALPVNDTKLAIPIGNVQIPVQTSSGDIRALPVNETKFDGHTGKVQVPVPTNCIDTRTLPVNDTKLAIPIGNVQVQVSTSSGVAPETRGQNFVDKYNRPTTKKMMIMAVLQEMMNKEDIVRAYKLNDSIYNEFRRLPVKFEDEIPTSFVLDTMRNFYRFVTRRMTSDGTLDTRVSLHTVFKAFEDLLKSFQSPSFVQLIADTQALRRLSAIHAFKILPAELNEALFGMVRDMMDR